MSEPAQAPAPAPAPEDATKRMREKVDKLLARDPCKSEASIVLGGRTLAYRAIAEFVPVVAGGVDDKRGDPEAAVFTTSYFLAAADPATRPVCFVFNGGPGSASIWLHLGALGPKRVVIREDGTMPPPPYTVTDNQESWFEHFDLVFIDPPHTGYSITASDDARKKMLSVDGDVDALAECIRTWLGRHRRWSSPVYVAGESYGTTRGAALADKLQDIGVALSGLVLVSCAMDLQSVVFAPRNDLPYALFLPAFACVAQYHGKLKGRLAESPAAARAAAEEFVVDEYLAALHAGSRLSKAARRRVVNRVAELTGLAPIAGRGEEPAHQRPHVLRRAAARPRPDRRPARGARHRTDGREPLARLGVRPGHRSDRRAVHDGRARVHEREPGRGHAGALRSAVDGRAQAVELEPRRGEGQQLRLHESRPVARAAPQSRTCACWSRAVTTISGRRTARPTGRSRSSTCRPTCSRASSTTTTTPAT